MLHCALSLKITSVMQTNYLLQHCKAKYFHHIVYFFSHGSENKQLLFHSTAAESNLDC